MQQCMPECRSDRGFGFGATTPLSTWRRYADRSAATEDRWRHLVAVRLGKRARAGALQGARHNGAGALMATIFLVRHGRPDVDAGLPIGAAQMEAWIGCYDAAGLVSEPPPRDAVVAAEGAAVLISSTLRRAVESGQALAPERCHLQDPLFNEAALPHAAWRFPRLSPRTWAAIFRLAWCLGFHGKEESLRQARTRARVAAARLMELADAAECVLLCGHGVMNQLIARELVDAGWQGPKRPASRHWGVSRYRR